MCWIRVKEKCFVLEFLFAFIRTKFARSRSQVFVCFFSKKEAIRVTAKHLCCSSLSFQSCHVCVNETLYVSKRWANSHSLARLCETLMMSVTVSERCSRFSCCRVEASLLACHMLSLLKTVEFYQKQSFWMFLTLGRAFFPRSKGAVKPKTTTSLGTPTHAFNLGVQISLK